MSSKCNCFSKERRSLKAKFPPCPCTTCKQMRASGGVDRAEMSDDGGEGRSKRNFVNFFAEAMGIIAFLMIATIMFWLSVTYYLFQFSMKIYRSDRNTQIAALVLIALLCVSISVSLIRKNLKNKAKLKAAAAATGPKPAPTAPLSFSCYKIPTKSGEKIELVTKASGNVVPCNMLDANYKTVTKNITVTITDSEAREIFKQSKLFAIPTEMKQPPALLVYLRDVILRNY